MDTAPGIGRITPREVALIVDDRKRTRTIQRREPSPAMLGAERQMSALLAAGNYREAERLMDSPAYTGKPAAPKPTPKPVTLEDLTARVHPDGRPTTIASLVKRVTGMSVAEYAEARARRKADTQADPAMPPRRKRRKRGAPNPPDGYDAALHPAQWVRQFDPNVHPVSARFRR